MAYQKILVPLDGSPLAELAADHAVEVAQMSKAALLFLRVAPTEGCQEAAQYLYDFEQKEPYKALTLKAMVRYGSPAEVIARTAREYDVDLVVLSSHGRTGLVRQVFGSVAEAVVRTAPCPVTVVKSFPDSRAGGA